MTHSPLPHADSGHPHRLPPDARDLAIHDPMAESFPPGLQGRLLWAIAIAFSVFQIATAAHFVDFPSQVVRAVHVGFLLLLAARLPFLFIAGRWYGADALGRWAYHCHLLYHMEAGMMREVRVEA